jgi:hypothetical protein
MKGMLGGITGPTIAEAAVIPAVNRSGYPAARIALTSTWPRPPMSATATPDMPAKIMLPTTFTWPSPPGTAPTRLLAKRKMRCVMPASLRMRPARMKSGIASSGKEFSD